MVSMNWDELQELAIDRSGLGVGGGRGGIKRMGA